MMQRGTLTGTFLVLVAAGLGAVSLDGCSGDGSSTPGAVPLSHASSIAVDATDVYWLSGDSSVVRQNKDGGPVVVVATEPCRGLDDIALDDQYVYWSHGYVSASCPAGVSRAPKGGGPAETVATDMIFPGRGGIVLDDRAVYMVGALVANGPVNDAASASRVNVYAVQKAGGEPNAIAGPIARGAPALGGRNVYWVSDLDYGSSAPRVAIMRTDPSGISTKVATLSENVVALAFYGDRIYWGRERH